MNTANWTDAQNTRAILVGDGWRSPDTYSNFFEPIGDFPAVYLFLVHEREEYRKAFVAYVGMSENLAQRMSGHEVLNDIGKSYCWTMRWFKPVPIKDLRGVERRYIERFDPPWNIVGRRRGVALN